MFCACVFVFCFVLFGVFFLFVCLFGWVVVVVLFVWLGFFFFGGGGGGGWGGRYNSSLVGMVRITYVYIDTVSGFYGYFL